MIVHLIVVGTRVPPWIESGFHHYARRLPRQCTLELVAVPAVKRIRGGPQKVLETEGQRLLKRIPGNCHVVALSESGARLTTRALADHLGERMRQGTNLALLVGGPDGLDPQLMARADACWSLSDLTFPHALVRIIVAEQVYRAWTILSRHPYHRE